MIRFLAENTFSDRIVGLKMKGLNMRISTGVTIAWACLLVGSSAYCADMPNAEAFEKQYGSLFRIDDEAASKLTNSVERVLHQTKIPEVVFAQANLRDIAYFLHKATVQYSPTQDKKGVEIVIRIEDWGSKPPVPTLAAKNVSVLEVIRIMTNVCGIDMQYKIEDGKVILYKKIKKE